MMTRRDHRREAPWTERLPNHSLQSAIKQNSVIRSEPKKRTRSSTIYMSLHDKCQWQNK